MFDLEKAKANGSYRELKRTETFGKLIRYGEKSLLNLASNDYLGIATNRSLRDEFLQTIPASDLFFGSGASRLVYSSNECFFDLEKNFEKRLGKKALLFNSGYAANLGTISALADSETLFIADKLIHASMIDALKLSRANFKRYAHNDSDALERLVEKHSKEFRQIIILTEAVFSMDGDSADLKRLVQIKRNYPNVKLYVDEAHSFFTLYENGLCKALGIEAEIDCILVTLSKALGGSGAVLLSDEETSQILVNSARSLIFSTALPSIDVAWTNFVLSKDFSPERKNLQESIDTLGLSASQICPFIVGENLAAIELAQSLNSAGFFVPAIRPPTVPEGTARLRISLRGDISPKEIQPLKEILDAYSRNHLAH